MFIRKSKLSYYTILTDAISEENKNHIIFSTRTSKAFIINPKVRNALVSNELHKLSKKIKQNLIEGQILVAADENELNTIINENKTQIASDELFYQVIQPSAMCQLGCDYCGQDHKKINIDYQLIDKLIDRYSVKLKEKAYNGIYIGWFGGEPMMALNEIRIMSQKLKKLAKENGIGYGAKMVTNGLSLKPKLFRELVLEHHVKHFEITLDGIAEFHDDRRHTKEGHSTFNIIFENLDNIFSMPDYQDLECAVSIRCNVDKRNYLGVSPLIKKMAKHNFQDYISHFYVASVYSWGNDAHLKSFTKEEFSEMEINWLIEQFEHGFSPGLLPGRVKTVCLAVNPNNEMSDAYGNLFNCTEVSYVDVYKNTEYELGNLKFDDPGAIYKRPLSNWNDEVLNGEFQCHSCKMLPVCGGGCPKSWHEDMRACPTNKFNIREKLLLAYVRTKLDTLEIVN